MECINKYSVKEQEFIINSGIMLLNECKKYNNITINKNDNGPYFELKLERMKNNKLLKELNEIENKIKKEKDNEFKVINMIQTNRINELRDKIEKIEKKELLLIKNREYDINMAIKNQNIEIYDYKLKLKNMENEILELKKLHEASNKGSILEGMVLKRCIDYNNNLNNVWKIIDTSSISHKGDIQFEHRYKNKRFLIDLKNYNGHVAKREIDKIKDDILNNDVDGGILISTNKICGKMNWGEEDIESKKLIYITDFKLCDINLIFRELNRLLEITNKEISKNNIEEIITNNLNSYKKLTKWVLDMNIEICKKKELHKKLTGMDIDIYIKTRNKIGIDYNKLEYGYMVMGRRSKYYHKYTKDSKKIIQYKGSKNSIDKWKLENKLS